MFEPLDNLLGHERYRFAFIFFFALIVVFTKIGGTGLATWDDCFYAQKAKEITQTGSWMTMHYAGEPSLENPPFFIWLVALSYKIWGATEYGAIFPSASFGVLCVALVYVFARKLFGPWAAFFGSIVLATTFFFTKYARHAMIDVALSFFVMLALFALLLAIRRDERYFILWGLAISVAILLKSVLGFFPALISVVFLIATGRWNVLFRKWFMIGSGLVLLVGCSWYIHQYATFGKYFLDVHFGWQIFYRGFELASEPWYAHLSYITDLLHDYWPWVPVFAWSLYRFTRLALQRDEDALLFVLWVVIMVGVMSLTQSRMLWYIMPVFPAAAMMCGHTISGWVKEGRQVRVVRWIFIFGVAVGVGVNFTPVQLSSMRGADVRTIAPYVKHLVQRDVTLVGYGYEFHSINNPLLFYSDVAARPLYDNIEDLSKQFAGHERVACVVDAAHLDSLLEGLPNPHVIRRTDGACLITNTPFDVSGVKTW